MVKLTHHTVIDIKQAIYVMIWGMISQIPWIIWEFLKLEKNQMGLELYKA